MFAKECLLPSALPCPYLVSKNLTFFPPQIKREISSDERIVYHEDSLSTPIWFVSSAFASGRVGASLVLLLDEDEDKCNLQPGERARKGVPLSCPQRPLPFIVFRRNASSS